MADAKLIELLNKALAMEYQAIIQYRTHAELIAGETYEPVAARLKEVAGDEEKHADILRVRISMLGAVPATVPEKVVVADKIPEVLKVNIKAEREAIAVYRQILPLCRGNEILEHAIRHILIDEEEHTEEFSQLLGVQGEIKYQ
ncbi:MAG: ferritin-like domain-containing protein [Candidatus Micrarchaeia archaeon]